MPPRKSKNKNRPSTASFVAWWATLHAAFWIVLSVWGLSEERVSMLNDPFTMLGIPFITLLVASLQGQLLAEFQPSKQVARQWIVASVLGSLISVVAFNALTSFAPILSAIALLVPIATVQALWLGRHVKSAWLWLLASLMSTLLFAFPVQRYDTLWGLGIGGFVLLFGAMFGLIQAAVMRHLLQQPLESPASKPDQADDFEDHEAVARLSLEQSADMDFIDSETLIQQQSR